MAYYSGSWKMICDVCGSEALNTEMVKTWDNLWVHRATCFDGPRNPQDYRVKARNDKQSVRDARPELPRDWISKYIMTEDSDYFITETGDRLSEEYTS